MSKIVDEACIEALQQEVRDQEAEIVNLKQELMEARGYEDASEHDFQVEFMEHEKTKARVKELEEAMRMVLPSDLVQETERLRAEADGERARRRELEAVGREESKDRARLSDQLAEARAYLMDLKVRACEPCPHAEETERLRAALDDLVMACELPGQHCEVEQALPVARAALSQPEAAPKEER